jgi:hypothetical protein
MVILQHISAGVLGIAYLTASCSSVVQVALPGVGGSGRAQVTMARGSSQELPKQAIKQYKHLPAAKTHSLAPAMEIQTSTRPTADEHLFYVSRSAYASPLQHVQFFPLFDRPPPTA